MTGAGEECAWKERQTPRERSLTTAGEAAACSPVWDLRASSVSIQRVTGGVGGGSAAEVTEDGGRTVVSLINQ